VSRSSFSERSQRAILWWGIGMAIVYAIALIFLFDMVPLKNPEWSARQVSAWYATHHTRIVWGAVIGGWVGAFMMPILTVVTIQIERVEVDGPRIWSRLSLVSGALMSLMLVLPPLFWGVAAYTQNRVDPEVTTVMHELGSLTLATTDQYYIFLWVAISVFCFRPSTAEIPNNPFPGWWGYLSLWITLMFEAGAFAFVPRTGPLAWNGLLVFWSPLTLFGLWITIQSWLIFRALRAPEQAITRDEAPEPVATW